MQKRHFGEPLAWLVSETGDVNTYVHIWVYEDAEDRNRKRAALFKDPEWLKYIEMNAEAATCIKQESKLMSPAPFAPLKTIRNAGEVVLRLCASRLLDGVRYRRELVRFGSARRNFRRGREDW